MEEEKDVEDKNIPAGEDAGGSIIDLNGVARGKVSRSISTVEAPIQGEADEV